MENVKIIVDGMEKDVLGLLYVYNSKYYFIYTEKELDESGYVILYSSQIGKETVTTEYGVVDTGYMIGVNVTDPEEQSQVQKSISYIVEDKKNNTINPEIQYMPLNILTNLKIVGKKRFRLLKSLIEDNFKIHFDEESNFLENSTNILSSENQNIQEQLGDNENVVSEAQDLNVIIDYRSKYFEEVEKSKELEENIMLLNKKIEEIKKIVE